MTAPFTVIPAIDLKDGRCVRLRQGRADDVCVYGDDPVAMARHWQAEGASYLHVVDLDGALQGWPVHAAVIARIVLAAGVPVEVGGGLRTDADIRVMLDGGVDRVVIGTRAVEDCRALADLAARYGPQLAVGIDARDGWVQVRGWVETTKRRAVDLAVAAARSGVNTVIYTDTATDGMLGGPNARAVEEICEAVECGVVASGGIRSAGDIRTLCGLGAPNLVGAIVGKALYAGGVTLRELTAAASPPAPQGETSC